MTTDRHDPDATPTHQDEFWGEQSEWTPQRRPSAARHSLGSTIGRWWDGLLGGSTGAEHDGGNGHRAHGRSAPVEDHAPVDDGDEPWTFEPESRPVRHLGADPLLTRLGGLAVIVTLAAPLLLGFTSSGSDSQSTDPLVTITGVSSVEPAAPAAAPLTETAATATTASTAPAIAPPTAPPTSAPVTAEAATPVSAPAAAASLQAAPALATTTPATTALAVTAPVVTAPATTALAVTAPVVTSPVVTGPACGKQYELAAGDYWIRIADAAEVSLADLLAVNGSSVDTMLVPGRPICLPVGASTPLPPPTTPTTTVPATTVPAAVVARAPTTTAPRRPAPTTTVAPTQTAPARPAAVPSSQATAIIRQVWPDDLEERAIEIAWRESNHKSNVDNFCCYGLFQIYYSVHKSWLSTIGVDSAQYLFDPQLNAQAAYMLYQRAGGFGPWGG